MNKLMTICVALLLLAGLASAADLRLGIIGTDTSHATAFTKIFNDASAPDHVPGARVVAAYKGGSPDLPVSFKRVDGYANELATKYGVEFLPDIATLCQKVDAVLLTSVDGRVHLKQTREVIAARKPMFIDKPLAATLEDAREIARLAADAHVPWFSASSIRFNDGAVALKFQDTKSAVTWGPGELEPLFPLDLSWYAIHSIEVLYALMGPGCQEVQRLAGEDSDVMIGRWPGGRTGTVYALRGPKSYGAVVFRAKTVSQSDISGGYAPLLRDVVKFFQTGQPPVSNEETLEEFAFMDAAQRSKANGGQPMKLSAISNQRSAKAEK